MWMLIVAWRVLVKVLRHLGWGIFLVPVVGMGILLFGVTLWTVAAALLAGALAIQWPTVAARVLPPAMVGAGLSGLVIAGRTPGSPVSWLESRIQSSFAVRAVPGKALPPPRWYTYVPGQSGEVSVTYLPPVRAAQALARKIAIKRRGIGGPPVGGKGQVAAVPRKFVQWNAAVKGPGPQWSVSIKGPGPQHAFIGMPGPQQAFAKLHGVPPRGIIGAVHVFAPPGWPVPGFWHGRLLVPLALLLLTLGLWLTPRSLAGLRGRGATLAPDVRRWLVENRWSVLLVPVTLLGLTVFGVRPWTIAAIIAAVVVLARWPRVAGDLVPVVLAIFAIRGFQLAANWQSMAGALQGPPAPSPVMFGAVDVSTPATALLAGVEASMFLAFGAWLVPRTIGAHARTAFTPGD